MNRGDQTNFFPNRVLHSIARAMATESTALRAGCSRRSFCVGLLLSVCTAFFFSARVAVGAQAAEDAPEIEVAVSAEEIYVGETIDCQVEIRNVQNPSPPDVSAFREKFEVVANGDQSQNQSSTFIVNGRVSQQNVFSHIYLYRLTPKTSGDLTIPPLKITLDGNELFSRSILLRVREPEEQDLVLVEVKTDPESVYPTQPFTVTARILVQPLPEGETDPLKPVRRQPPHLQVNWVEATEGLSADQTSTWLQPLMSEDGTGFTLNEVNTSTGSIFGGARPAVFNLSKGRETRNGIDGEPINYFVYELNRQFTAQKAGQYSFGPALVKGTFVAGIEGTEFLAKRLVAIAPAVNVEVREVPSPRPTTYIGGIGEYVVGASASPLKLRVGDPLTLTLEFAQGNQAGSLDLIAAPDLTLIPEIADSFEVIDKSPTGRVDGNVKRFGYALRPKRSGASIPSLALTTFDPAAENFKELKTEAIALDVSEAIKLSSGDLVGAVPSTSTNEIRKSTAGIFQNITDPATMRDERVSLAQWLTAAGGFWFLAGCVMASITLRRRRFTDVAGQRRSQARRTALTKLTTAKQMQTQQQPKEVLRHIRSAVIGLVADLQNRPAEGLTTADVGQALSRASVPENDRDATLRLMESIEGAEYGAGNTIDADEAIKSATSLIDRISPFLERSAGR